MKTTDENPGLTIGAATDVIDALKAEDKRLREACARTNDIICQILGPALGFPRYCDDQKNFPGATAEDGVCTGPWVAEDLASLAAERIAKLMRDREALGEALGFYADPETYFAIVFIPDRPCGEFIDDFSDDYGHPDLTGHRPGKLARKVVLEVFGSPEAPKGATACSLKKQLEHIDKDWDGVVRLIDEMGFVDFMKVLHNIGKSSGKLDKWMGKQ